MRGQGNTPHPRRHPGGFIVLLVGLLVLTVSGILGYSLIRASAAGNSTTDWKTFHDPLYGFSLSYPASWLLIPESDGSHITLYNPVTGTALSPLVTSQSGKPGDVIKRHVGKARTKMRTVAGKQAVDSQQPYVPPSKQHNHDAEHVGGPHQERDVIVPVDNISGSTTVYTFQFTQPTDTTGKTTTGEQADTQSFETTLSRFTLPAKVTAVEDYTPPNGTLALNSITRSAFSSPLNHSSVSVGGVSPLSSQIVGTTSASIDGCNRVCWADANWNFNIYSDVSTLYCADDAWYYQAYTDSAYCGDNTGQYVAAYNFTGIQVPSDGKGYWQPNFQCADFIARALTQDGLVPGLNSGGVWGSTPASPSVTGYGNYHAANGNAYYLFNVGVPGIAGLSNYLLENNLATNIQQDLTLATPGDLLFIRENGSSNYGHAMIITAISGNYLVLDGHNEAQYHLVKALDSTMDIFHLSASLSGGRSQAYAPSNGQGGAHLQIGYLPGSLHQMDVFALGTNKNIYEDYKTGDPRSAWSGWSIIGGQAGPAPFSSLSVTALSDGRPYLLAIDTSGNIWATFKTATDPLAAWSSWALQGTMPVQFTGQVQIATLPNRNLDLFALGKDGKVYQNYELTADPDLQWSGWISMGKPAISASLLNLSNFSLSDGRLTLLARASNGSVYATYMQAPDPTSWSAWGQQQGLSGVTFSTQVQASLLPDGRADMFEVASNGKVYQNYKLTTAPTAKWSGWTAVGGSPGAQLRNLTVGSLSDGRFTLFGTDATGQVWAAYMTSTSPTSWSKWSKQSGSVGTSGSVAGQVQIANLNDGRFYLFIVGKSNSLYQNYKTGGVSSSWSGWGASGHPSTVGLLP
ncbi:MAG TPA: amidase domain-containing protein [Ktedonobacteraceae bacterium]|nr:amidase domain-containing protein [Ktedonobacteraceae bacterium]